MIPENVKSGVFFCKSDFGGYVPRSQPKKSSKNGKLSKNYTVHSHTIV